jgi:hypothetical protein
MIVLALTAEASGGGPPPVCMAVDKVVVEPNDAAPTRIRIWGTFIFLDDSRTTYGAPVRGYLYYFAVPGSSATLIQPDDRIVVAGHLDG